MTLIRLPDNTPLHAKGPFNLAWEQGSVVFKGPVTYPTVGVLVKDVEGMETLMPQDNHLLLPVLVTPEGLQTDLYWWTLVKVQQTVECRHNRSAAFEWELESILEMVVKNDLQWSLKCPVMEGTQSLMGFLMTLHGYHAGAEENAGAAMQEPSKTLKTYPIKKLLKHAQTEDLQAFRDGTDTLLDLAFANFQWDAAEWLWKKGVRWSQETIDSGKPLEDLAAASTKLRSAYSSFLNQNWNKLTPAQRTEDCLNWLNPWLERWEALGVALPSQARLRRRAEGAKASNWTMATEIRDTPPTFWAARMAEQAGPKIQKLNTLEGHTRAVVDRWLLFWTRHGVEFETLMLPSANTSVRSFVECWKSAPDWMDHVRRFQCQARLNECLPQSGRIGNKPRF